MGTSFASPNAKGRLASSFSVIPNAVRDLLFPPLATRPFIPNPPQRCLFPTLRIRARFIGHRPSLPAGTPGRCVLAGRLSWKRVKSTAPILAFKTVVTSSSAGLPFSRQLTGSYPVLTATAQIGNLSYNEVNSIAGHLEEE